VSFGLSFLTRPAPADPPADCSAITYCQDRQLSVVDGQPLHETIPVSALWTLYETISSTDQD
jgi:putative ATP-grasp target RiPP